MPARIVYNANLSLRSKEGVISGSILYNTESVDLGGGFKEILKPGAFEGSLDDVYALNSHLPDQPLGSTKNNTLLIEDTSTSLNFYIEPDVTTTYAKDLIKNIKSGLISGVSFGMNILEDEYDHENNIRYIIKAELAEISPVLFPAYPANKITARNTVTFRNYIQIGASMSDKNKARIKTLKEYHNQLSNKQKAMLDQISEQKRAFTESEQTMWDNIETRLDETTTKIHNLERELAEDGGDFASGLSLSTRFTDFCEDDEKRTKQTVVTTADYIFDEKRAMGKGASHRDIFNLWLRNSHQPYILNPTQLRALQADIDSFGGYLVPEELAKTVLTSLDNILIIRKKAKKFTLKKASSLGVPTIDNDPSDPDWTSELGTGGEDSTMDFGKRELCPQPLAKRIKVSNNLLRVSPINPETLVRDRLIYKQSVAQENNFLNGNGVSKPLGVFTTSDSGITASRDVSTGNTTTSVQGDNIKEVVGTLKEQYRKNAIWIMHRDLEKRIKKLKGGDGRYLWQPSISLDNQPTLEGYPYYISEYCPNTFSSGQLVAIFGDFSYYWIVDALSMQVQKLVELYAATAQTGFIIRSETDGMPVIEEAFVRMAMGT